MGRGGDDHEQRQKRLGERSTNHSLAAHMASPLPRRARVKDQITRCRSAKGGSFEKNATLIVPLPPCGVCRSPLPGSECTPLTSLCTSHFYIRAYFRQHTLSLHHPSSDPLGIHLGLEALDREPSPLARRRRALRDPARERELKSEGARGCELSVAGAQLGDGRHVAELLDPYHGASENTTEVEAHPLGGVAEARIDALDANERHHLHGKAGEVERRDARAVTVTAERLYALHRVIETHNEVPPRHPVQEGGRGRSVRTRHRHHRRRPPCHQPTAAAATAAVAVITIATTVATVTTAAGCRRAWRACARDAGTAPRTGCRL
eukprot:scaffold8734_cov50-Phaeocystis_antarctica.AAC.2